MPAKMKCVTKELNLKEYMHEQVKENHINLKPEHQLALLQELKGLYKKIMYHAWKNEPTRKLLWLEYQRRRSLEADGNEEYATLSKMGRDYNAAKRGRNAEVKARMNVVFPRAMTMTLNEDLEMAALVIQEANLSPRFVLYNDEIPGIVETHNEEIREIVRDITECQSLLVQSVLKAAMQIAYINMANLSGEILEFADLVQVARHSAMQATIVFDTDKEHSAWAGYVYNRMRHDVVNYITDNSRTVSVPRNIIYRFTPVQRAIDIVGMSDIEKIAMEASKIFVEQKGRKLKPKEVYTVKEVENLLKHVSEWMSLDITVNENAEETREVALVETLPSNEHVSENEAEKAMIRRSLRNLLEKKFGEEYEILALLWGLDEQWREITLRKFFTPKQVLTIWRERHPGKKMHQVRIKAIAEKAMRSLKDEKDPELLKLWDAYNTIRTTEE